MVSQGEPDIGLEQLQNGHTQDDDCPPDVMSNSNSNSDHPATPGGVNRRLERIESTVTRILDSRSVTSHQNPHNNPETIYRQLMNDPVRLQWKLMAAVMDRLCFCIYFIIIILSYIFFFPRPQ